MWLGYYPIHVDVKGQSQHIYIYMSRVNHNIYMSRVNHNIYMSRVNHNIYMSRVNHNIYMSRVNHNIYMSRVNHNISMQSDDPGADMAPVECPKEQSVKATYSRNDRPNVLLAISGAAKLLV